jgi:hypothetical protein
MDAQAAQPVTIDKVRALLKDFEIIDGLAHCAKQFGKRRHNHPSYVRSVASETRFRAIKTSAASENLSIPRTSRTPRREKRDAMLIDVFAAANFCPDSWQTEGSRQQMEAGITNHVWSIEALIVA